MALGMHPHRFWLSEEIGTVWLMSDFLSHVLVPQHRIMRQESETGDSIRHSQQTLRCCSLVGSSSGQGRSSSPPGMPKHHSKQESVSRTSERVRMTENRRERLLAVFSNNPISTTVEAFAALGVARFNVSKDISELELAERLAHEGSLEGDSWVVS